MPIIYLALGTNLGHRRQNLQDALQQLPPTVTITTISRLYETKAAYVEDQPDFLNMVLKGQTELSPAMLLAYLKTLEIKIGRQKTFRYGPRQLDLDILFYDDVVLDTPGLQIPHPRLAERGFVLHPLHDVASDFQHPILGKTIQQLVGELPSEDGIMRVVAWE